MATAARGRFEGKVAVVTGAASGIGAATAAELERDGATVWRAVLSPPRAPRACRLDVTEAASWSALVAAVIAAGDGWHILVNAAGIASGGGPQDVAAIELQGWRRVFAVNVEGTLVGCQQALAVMGADAAIVNIASTAGVAPSPALAAYGASKAAVIQLTRSVAAAGAARTPPVRCNAVVPGMAQTAMTAGMDEGYRSAWTRQIPARRFGTAGEVAAVICFLASDAAAYVTGSAWRVDGGMLARPVIG